MSYVLNLAEALVKRRDNPYYDGYAQGIQDAVESVNQSLRVMLDEAVYRIANDLKDNQWKANAFTTQLTADARAIDFRIEVRNMKEPKVEMQHAGEDDIL